MQFTSEAWVGGRVWSKVDRMRHIRRLQWEGSSNSLKATKRRAEIMSTVWGRGLAKMEPVGSS